MRAGKISAPVALPTVIGVRGARHNSLRDIDVDVPLWRTVAMLIRSRGGRQGADRSRKQVGTGERFDG